MHASYMLSERERATYARMRTRAYTWDNSVATELIAVLPIFGLDNLLHLMVSPSEHASIVANFSTGYSGSYARA